MASPIIYSYEPNTTVWVITTDNNGCNPAVDTGIVIRVRIDVLTTETLIEYDIRLDGDKGTTVFVTADIFSTLTAAVDEYEIRLT